VKFVKDNLRWVDWERYSSRQDTKINLGGLLVGEATYEGDLAEFMPLIRLGELIHVGKGTVLLLCTQKVDDIFTWMPLVIDADGENDIE
jgi:hypothetical protein